MSTSASDAGVPGREQDQGASEGTRTGAKRGAFIVIEGLDRSGKSTQAALLLARLQTHGPAKLIKFPDRTTPIGKLIDAYLRAETELDDRAIHLLFSANRWELASSIEADLRAGTTVLCDRYAFSGIAFSAAKLGPTEPTPLLPYEWCAAPDTHLPVPDLTLFFDIPPALAEARGGYGAERYERAEMQARVRTVFGRIGEDVGRYARWVRVDVGEESVEEMAERVWGAVEGARVVGGVDESVGIGRLWGPEDEGGGR